MTDKIIEVIREAGKIVLNAKCDMNDISEKDGDANYVTKYDIAVQEFLKENILKIVPNATFFAEEDEESEQKFSTLTIVADPIDGTTNFIRGYNHSCISVAILKDRIPVFGCVYNPYLDEIFTAKLGEGAYLNGKRIKVSGQGMKNALVSFGTSPYYRGLPEKTFSIIQDIFPTVADLRRSGSAALDICYVAAGRTELYFELLLSPWDFAAGSLILQEAGGVIKTFDGSDISFDKKYPIIAATPKAYNEFIKMIK